MSGSDGNIEISSSGFHLRPDGTATFSGSITASAGEIGGWKVESDRLKSKNNAMMLSGSGVISTSYFYVNELGDLSASSGWFMGTVTASRVETDSGEIAGWTIKPGLIASSVEGGGNSAISLSSAEHVIRIGSASTFDHTTVDGLLMGISADGGAAFQVGSNSEYLAYNDNQLHISTSHFDVQGIFLALMYKHFY